MRVYFGKVEVFGYIFHPSPHYTPLFAPESSFVLSIKSFDDKLHTENNSNNIGNDSIGIEITKKLKREGKNPHLPSNGAIIILKPLREHYSPPSWYDKPDIFFEEEGMVDPFLVNGLHPILNAPSGCSFIHSLIVINFIIDWIIPKFTIDPSFDEFIAKHIPAPSSLQNPPSPFVILVCGPTNSGKSTMCRYLSITSFVTALTSKYIFGQQITKHLQPDPLFGS